MQLSIFLTHAEKLPPQSLSKITSMGFRYEHRPLIKSLLRDQQLPSAQQYILSSASAIKFLIGKTLPPADYWAIGARTAEWATTLIPELKDFIKYPHGHRSQPYSLLHLVEHLPVRPTIWLGSSQGLLRHQQLWQSSPWIEPFITHWVYPHLGALSLDWSKPAHISCHCQNAAVVLNHIKIHPLSRIWLPSDRLLQFLPHHHNQIKIMKIDWLEEILQETPSNLISL